MKKYVFGEYERISKAAARRAFLNGEKIEMFPCNAVPGSVWFPFGYVLSRKAQEDFVIDEIGMNNRFTGLVNSFEYYNCNAQMGRYAAFYRKIAK